jgi:putative aldouronate transport system substrate-binding protein
MWCNLQEFHRLADAGLLADLTGVEKQYASPYMKSIFAAAPRSLAAATVNGQLLAIPDTPVDYQYQLLWVRKDWLDKVHMPAPKTIDDIAAVAQAFVKAQLGGPNTVGLVGPGSSNALGQNTGGLVTYNGVAGFDSLLASYGAFETWYMRKNGKIVYGSVQPEMKAALSKLHDLYQAGVIDQQFASRSNNDMVAQITGGKCGMFFGPWWMGFYPLNNAAANDPKADWRPYVAPIGASGKMEASSVTAADAFVVVRKGFAHPEAIIKVLNVSQDVLRGRNPDPAARKIYLYAGQNTFWPNIPLLVQFDYVDNVLRTYPDVIVPVQKHNPSLVGSYDNTHSRYITSYNQLVAYEQHPDPVKNNSGYALWSSYMYGVAIESVQKNLVHMNYPLDYYPTPTMLKRQATLQSLELRTMLGIVTGQYPLSQFDSFVSEWNALGGKTILQELEKQLG